MNKKIGNRCLAAGFGFMAASLLLFDGVPEKLQRQYRHIFYKETSSNAAEKLQTGEISTDTEQNLHMNLYAASQMQAYYDTVKVTSPSDIYTFSQGPVAWKERKTWSGKWGNMTVDGNRFGAFGCGFCCMANIYCTLTPYLASPVDVYRYAKEVTEYKPAVGAAAIHWDYMQQVLGNMGMQTELKNKTSEFETFKQDVETAKAMIVLVSSYEDDSFWKDTPGHYVTLWLYNEDEETVLVGDSGDPDRNRQVIPLKKVYKALKNASTYQYLMVTGYQENSNIWKWNEITEKWISPKEE